MEQTTITAATFTPTELFALVERLPETFRRDGRCRFVAMDDQNTYVIDSSRHRDSLFSPAGFTLAIISRHEPSYREHRFDICVDAEGIALVEALRQFITGLRRLEKSDISEIELGPFKCAFHDARHTIDMVIEGDDVEPTELVREALEYVLGQTHFRGLATFMLGTPIWMCTSTHERKFPVDLPVALATLKPALCMDVEDGELRTLTDASFTLRVPERNVVEEMKALNRLTALGLSDDDMKELDDFAAAIAQR